MIGSIGAESRYSTGYNNLKPNRNQNKWADTLAQTVDKEDIGSDEYLHGAMAGKAGGNTIYNVRCHCVGILFLQIPKTFGKGGIHTAAVLQFSCVKLFDCRQYLSMYSGEHI